MGVADETRLAERIQAVLQVVLGVTPAEYERIRSGLLLDSEDREGPPVKGDTR